MATIAHFAAPPGSREVSTGSPWAPTPLDVPGAHESGDSCALRSTPREPRKAGSKREEEEEEEEKEEEKQEKEEEGGTGRTVLYSKREPNKGGLGTRTQHRRVGK